MSLSRATAKLLFLNRLNGQQRSKILSQNFNLPKM